MMISGSNLSKSFGKRKVLDEVSIECAAGEISGLLGANGAGKTTLFKILFGLITPDSGHFSINSKSVKPIGGIIEKPALYEYLNAYDNIKVFGSIQNVRIHKNFVNSLLTKVGLPLDRNDPVANYSLGMKQRLGIAIALLNNPACLVLDEPFSGLDPMGVAALRNLIVDLAEKENLAIILSSHIIEELSRICHTLVVIKEGKIVNAGLSQKIIAENTETYAICANNITHSNSLQPYHPVFKGQCVHVQIAPDKVSELIQQLHAENIYVTSCTPELNMEKLFETTAQ